MTENIHLTKANLPVLVRQEVQLKKLLDLTNSELDLSRKILAHKETLVGHQDGVPLWSLDKTYMELSIKLERVKFDISLMSRLDMVEKLTDKLEGIKVDIKAIEVKNE